MPAPTITCRLHEIYSSSHHPPCNYHQAYHKLALLYHPDRNTHDLHAAEAFKRIGGAFQRLVARHASSTLSHSSVCPVPAPGSQQPQVNKWSALATGQPVAWPAGAHQQENLTPAASASRWGPKPAAAAHASAFGKPKGQPRPQHGSVAAGTALLRPSLAAWSDGGLSPLHPQKQQYEHHAGGLHAVTFYGRRANMPQQQHPPLFSGGPGSACAPTAAAAAASPAVGWPASQPLACSQPQLAPGAGGGSMSAGTSKWAAQAAQPSSLLLRCVAVGPSIAADAQWHDAASSGNSSEDEQEQEQEQEQQSPAAKRRRQRQTLIVSSCSEAEAGEQGRQSPAGTEDPGTDVESGTDNDEFADEGSELPTLWRLLPAPASQEPVHANSQPSGGSNGGVASQQQQQQQQQQASLEALLQRQAVALRHEAVRAAAARAAQGRAHAMGRRRGGKRGGGRSGKKQSGKKSGKAGRGRQTTLHLVPVKN